MKLIRNSLAAGVAFATLAVAACSSQHGSTGSASGTGANGGGGAGSLVDNGGGIGTVNMNLDIGQGFTLTSVNWTISNGTNTFTGSDPIGDAQSLEFVAGGIVAGSGYTVTINGTDSNSDPCHGVSSPFTVIAGQTVQTVLGIVCTVPPDGSVATTVDGGSVEVDAMVMLVNTGAVTCPAIESFSIFPAEINTAGSATVTALTAGPAGVVTWSVSPANGGTFGNVNATTTTFQCANVPSTGSQVTVTATVALPDSGLCSGQQFTTMSALVNCESGALVCGTGLTICGPDGGQACANLQTDLNNCGTCGNVCPAADGGGSVATCSAGKCAIVSTPATTVCTQLVGGKPADSTGNTNCVTCAGTALNNGVCTATEALIVQRDIAQGNVQANGQLKPGKAGSCYNCLNANPCLDDNQQDTGNECADAPDLAGGAAGSGVTQCLATLTCITSTDCQGAGGIAGTSAVASQESIQLCYCGGNNAGSLCSTAGPATNGLCDTQEAAGFGFPVTDNKDILANYGSQTFPSGIANAIYNCAVANKCTICQ